MLKYVARALGICSLPLFVLIVVPAVHGQYAERGSLVGSGAADVDASGRSIKNPRVRAIHTHDPELPGGTAYFFQYDPFLAYQLGRNLSFREFRERDGIFGSKVANLGGPKLDGTTAKITANNQTSCSGCHNQPYGNPGGGNTFAKDSGLGRQAPHYYGAGIVEMLAIQIRASILAEVDLDKDGWISATEAATASNKLLVSTGTGGRDVDFGSARLSDGDIGVPGLNPIFRVWYGREEGGSVSIVPGASAIDGENTTHYNFEMVVWGWGQLAPPSALNPTNRAFTWDPYAAHSGLEAHDPSTLEDPDGDGVSEPTLAGAIQFPATHRAPDGGQLLDPAGFSLDDPDGDGHMTEISEGDLDLVEWYMLNLPRPAFAGTNRQYKKGIKLLEDFECTSCHVPDWQIAAQDDLYAGDRRFFDLDVTWNKKNGRLEGELIQLTDGEGQRFYDEFVVRGIFTDFRHHDMGDAYVETGYDGSQNRSWRTPPLWGVGTGYPWGHDGSCQTLDEAIARHGGEAADSRDLYMRAPKRKKAQLKTFLGLLQLYDMESLPTDLDGDGEISSDFMVQGVNTGTERFSPEWLFSTPVEIQGMVENSQGGLIRSFAARNLTEAYGLDLSLRRDSDLDGWPDVWDPAPLTPGFLDGLNN